MYEREILLLLSTDENGEGMLYHNLRDKLRFKFLFFTFRGFVDTK